MPTDPTGLEHLTPVQITSTSATERAAFRECKRCWFLGIAHRLDPQTGNIYSFLGNIVHRSLEAYYKAQMADPTDWRRRTNAALDTYQDAYDEEITALKKQVGFLWTAVGPDFRRYGELGMDMVQNYFERERLDPLFDEVIAVEFRVNVPILNPETALKVGELSVQADAVGTKNGELLVADHKTKGRAVDVRLLDMDDQLTAEAYSWWKHSGEMPDRIIYNVLMRKEAGPPKLIRNGKALSKDRGQGTTSALYRQAIADNSFDLADYVDHIAWLEEREANGDDPLFQRESTFRTPGQMAEFERNLYWEFADMKEVAAHPERAYPNPAECSKCDMRSLIQTMMDDGDVGAIIRAGFVIADPRR